MIEGRVEFAVMMLIKTALADYAERLIKRAQEHREVGDNQVATDMLKMAHKFFDVIKELDN